MHGSRRPARLFGLNIVRFYRPLKALRLEQEEPDADWELLDPDDDELSGDDDLEPWPEDETDDDFSCDEFDWIDDDDSEDDF